VVRQRIHANVLEHDHCGTTLNDAEEDVVRFWFLKGDREPEPVAIKRQRGGSVPDDEERRDARDLCCSHLSVPKPQA